MSRSRGIDSGFGGRMNLILLFFLASFLFLTGRLFKLQIADHKQYIEAASRQHRFVEELLGERGEILARNKNGQYAALASSRSARRLVASPNEIKDPEGSSKFIADLLNVEYAEILKKFGQHGDYYEVIAGGVNHEQAKKIDESGFPGLYIEESKERIYPQGSLAAQVLGFVSKISDEEEGRYGLESFYERELSGEKGILEGAKDAAGFWVSLGRRIINPPKNGSKIMTTLDYNIQQKAEEVLGGVAEKWGAEQGMVLVIDPKTGKILAMAANPSFDPSKFSKEKDFSVFLNPAVESMFELGSVMKPITMAGAVEEGLVGPNTTYDDTGEIKIKGYTIKNFDGKAYRTQTMTQVLEKSLNTGAVYAARLLGQDRQYDYLKRFGFGTETGIDLPGEIPGDLSNLDEGREIDFATASFGQGIAVTPLQMAMAVGALANGGTLMRPMIVERIVDDSGNEMKFEPHAVREVVSKETSETLTKMLVSVVRTGYENRSGVKGYFVAGKTGTAQIPRSDGRGYSERVIHTYVGYAPAFDPRFLVLFQLNAPGGNRFAANTLTPAFHDLAEYILNYYEIPPDER